MTLLSRYNLLVSEAVEDLLPDYKTKEVPSKDALDVFIKHRQMATARAQEGAAPGLQQPAGKTLPPELMRRYEVYFKAASAEKILPIREVKAQKIGKLVSIRGIITRATEVKPMMQVNWPYFRSLLISSLPAGGDLHLRPVRCRDLPASGLHLLHAPGTLQYTAGAVHGRSM